MQEPEGIAANLAPIEKSSSHTAVRCFASLFNSRYFNTLVLLSSLSAPVGATSSGAALPAAQSQQDVHHAGTPPARDDAAVTISFAPGSSLLSDVEQDKIKTFVRVARETTPQGMLHVATWSDRAFPKEKGQKLKAFDRSLAEQRGRNIEKILLEMGLTDVALHNMAQGPSFLGQLVSSRDAQLKKAAASPNQAPASQKDMQRILEAQGGPNKAVLVMVAEASSVVAH